MKAIIASLLLVAMATGAYAQYRQCHTVCNRYGNQTQCTQQCY